MAFAIFQHSFLKQRSPMTISLNLMGNVQLHIILPVSSIIIVHSALAIQAHQKEALVYVFKASSPRFWFFSLCEAHDIEKYYPLQFFLNQNDGSFCLTFFFFF